MPKNSLKMRRSTTFLSDIGLDLTTMALSDDHWSGRRPEFDQVRGPRLGSHLLPELQLRRVPHESPPFSENQTVLGGALPDAVGHPRKVHGFETVVEEDGAEDADSGKPDERDRVRSAVARMSRRSDR